MAVTETALGVEYLPTEVIDNYELSGQHVTRVAGGIVNQTYAARQGTDEIILQKVGPTFSEAVIDDFCAVTDFLTHKGWEVPTVVTTTEGQRSFRDTKGELWRAMTRLDADETRPTKINQAMCHEIGSLVARFHIDVQDFDYEPVHRIEHFHDTAYYAARLTELLDELTYTQRLLANRALQAYEEVPHIDSDEQLLHGDPKFNNILFRQGEPFTLIDFDTVMRGSAWIDIGDMLRSLGGLARPKSSVEDAVSAYYKTTEPDIDFKFFSRAAYTAQRRITVELAMRYLIDVVEGSYFDWDSTLFPTRAKHNEQRAYSQLIKLQNTQY